MIRSRFNNNRVKYLHKRCLRLIYNHKTSSYEELLEKDGSVSIQYKNIQTLAVEMFKIENGMSPQIVSYVFLFRRGNHYNFGQLNDFLLPSIQTVYHDSESFFFYQGPKIWSSTPRELKQESLKNFKVWKPLHCP